MRRAIALTLVVGLTAAAAADVRPAAEKPTPQQMADEAAKRAKQYKFDFKAPEYQDKAKVQTLATQGQQRGKGELDRMIQEHEDRRAAQGLAPLPGSPNRDEPNRPPVAGRIVVAVSSSMPDVMLRDYMLQLDGKPEAVVVMRGFVGGARTVAPTGQLIERIRRKQLGDAKAAHLAVETIVDPLLFRNLGIDKVPAVAWLPGVQDIKHCDREDYAAAVVVFGASSVQAALNEINRAGGAVPADVVKRYGGSGWETQKQ